MRTNFRVLAAGIATDGTKYEGQLIEFYFPKEEGLVPGDVFSAETYYGRPTDIDASTIFVEQGPSASRETRDRPEFESAGGPERDAVGWNPHRGKPHNGGASGQKSDSGRFSHPMLHEEKRR